MHGHRRPDDSRANSSAANNSSANGIVIRTYDLWKTYVMGDQEIHAVSGVTSRSGAANMSPSWVPPAPANRR